MKTYLWIFALLFSSPALSNATPPDANLEQVAPPTVVSKPLQAPPNFSETKVNLSTLPPHSSLAEPKVQNIRLLEALSTAIQSNRGLREAGLRIRSANASVQAASALFDTNLSANLNMVSQEAEFLPDQFFAITSLRKYSFDMQVSRVLPTGGMVGLQFSTSRTDQTMTIAMGGTPTEKKSKMFANSFTFIFSHPLLAGFGRDVTTAQLQKARLAADTERLAREAKAQALIRDVVTSYWNLWMAWQERSVLETSLKVAQSQVELTKSLLKVGNAKPSDLLAVENAVAQRQGDLMLSRVRILQASLQLKNLLGLPMDNVPLKPLEHELTYVPRTLPEALVEITLKRSRELAQLQKQLESLQHDERLARQGLLPKLNLTLTAGPTSSANEFSSAWENLVKLSAYTITGGLSFSWTVERTQAHAQLEMLESTRKILHVQKENLANSLTMAVLLARETMRTAERRIELAQVAVQSAQAHLKLENDLFQLGRGTNHSVLLRMAELDAARLSRIKAIYDYQTSWVQIQALSGDILQEYGLQLP